MENPAVSWLITSTIFMLMLTIGINEKWKDLTGIWKQPEVLWRSLLAVVVFVPALAITLIWLFRLPPAIATGIALLASCPGAPLTTLRSKMAGADVQYVSSLQLALALLAIVLTPLTLLIFNQMFETELIRVRAVNVIAQVAQVTLMPVIIGLLMQKFAPDFTARIRSMINIVAMALFGLLVVVVLAAFTLSAELRGILAIGWVPLIVIVVLISVSLLVGHLLGGPGSEQRAGLAVASIARNVGLAIYLAGLVEQSMVALPTILTYLVTGVVIGIPYAMYSKKQVKASG